MTWEKKWLERIGVIAALVDKAPGQTLGRTAVMKLVYFLQVLKKVPLGYDFKLHTFGPFDSDVLDDLAYAGVFGAIRERIVSHSQGYRYDIRPGRRCALVQQQSGDLLEKNREAVDWVAREFAHLRAADLELLSTIVFVDRENQKEGSGVDLKELAKQVCGIKPRFPFSYVLRKCAKALDKDFLQAVSN